jgi:hypothetical protein
MMAAYNRLISLAVVAECIFLCGAGWLPAYAQIEMASQAKDEKSDSPGETTAPESSKEKPAADAVSADKLALEEQRIADKYKHLEEVMLQMAELSAQTDPRRAALLKKAIAQSKEQLIEVRIERLMEFLEKDQLSRAIENQTQLDQDLRSLLEMLLSENRAKRILSEKARIREYLKRLGNILKQEKDVQARTADCDDAKLLAGQQGKIAEKTGGLAKDIQTNEEAGSQKTEGESKKTENGEKKTENGEKKTENGEKKTEGGEKKSGGEEKKTESDNKKADGGEGKAENGEGKPSDDKNKGQQQKQGEGRQGENQAQAQGQEQSGEDQQGNPARKRLEAAQKRMDEARKKLEKAQHEGAAKDQEEAVKELEQAKAELEQILRQLREEEVERVLAMLEARFRKMLEMQRDVYDGTVHLDKIPQAERTHNHEIESSRLSGKEMQIVVEIDKTLLVLRDDGTTVAFAEAADQMRGDMQQVVDRLSQAKVAQVTQGIELDIIATLEEMIDALKKAQKDLEKNRNKPGRPSGQEDSPLVDKLAELKMIRALQMRINTRTERYSKLVEGEQAENAELVDALKRLAERQQRVYKVTHDLSSGKTE